MERFFIFFLLPSVPFHLLLHAIIHRLGFNEVTGVENCFFFFLVITVPSVCKLGQTLLVQDDLVQNPELT